MENLSILFIGSKDIGYYCLNELIKSKINIVGVICRHDDPQPDQWYKSVTELAKENNLKFFKPEDINNPEFVEEISGLKPDYIICVQYPKIFKAPLLSVPKLGCINLHFAPLPKYRGCFPIPWAIINGEKEFGITLHYMDVGVDTGDIISQELFEIKETDNGKDLYKRCTEKGVELFNRILPMIKSGDLPRIKQDNSKSLKYDRELPHKGIIDWNLSSKEVHNFIRALFFPPFDCARTLKNGEKIHIPLSTIIKSEEFDDKKNGEIVEINEDGFLVKTADHCLQIPKIQVKNDLIDSKEHLKSNNIKVGDILGE